ncbi:MAG: TonB-dependent receptor [Opitutales bacterium]|jgi:iron complex outermembrane recepter protein|nr:TonB-dependent receptor [Opitutales bacterium]MDP4645367.1 TonB-dependent receptor [Opitutales bacterium]MDP4777404.1 TonB-dependent receptor [Opitutales bacterium]MDP4882948.1 TonB-dependent receptor [Opitutales bacterium]MDP5080253.1 TonB-dependent receptor [Opitutales bacterium]
MKQTVTILAAAALFGSLHAEENTEIATLPQLEATTIVTGSLWESELQQTTASVSVISEDALQSSGTQHFQDIVNSIPNLTWTGGSSRPRYIQIRGIGENSQFEGETPDSSVRFLVDDLDFTGIGTIGNLFDVQQVEVLRGPQAGAFGANAAGGVIRIVTNEPTPYWTGQVEGTAGDDSLLAAGIAVGGPILKNDPQALTFRFSAYQLEQDGFRDNAYLNTDDSNGRDELNTRLKLRWIANEDWQWDATLFYADADNGYDEWSLDNAGFETKSDFAGRDEQESIAGSLRGTWTGLDNIEVSTITSYSDTDSLNSYDADWTNIVEVPLFTVYSGVLAAEREREVFTQELRFDSADQEDALGWIDRWTVGAYFNHLNEETLMNYDDEYDSAVVVSDYETNTYALFGQIAHDFSDTTRLIVGLRYELHEVDFNSTTIDNYDFGFGDTLANGSNRSQTDDHLFGGKLTLEHDLNSTQTLHASVTRGYKAGGANSGSFRDTTSNQPLTYEQETLWNYEVGLSSQWLDGALTSQITLFYLDRDDAQLRDSDGAGGFFTYFTSNKGSAQHYGLEAEATWYVNKNWTATAGLGLMEAEADATSKDLANTPHYTYNLRLDYRADNGFFANLEFVGSDAYYESNSADNTEQRSSYNVLNGAVGYRYENWTLTLWGRNLLDESYEKRVFFFDNTFDGNNARYENPADPKQFGATLNYRW